MKNKTSKIILAASLLASGITTAQEFYTCVPKKDWWLDVVREGSKKWKKIIHLTPQSRQSDFQQTLQAGKYRVTAAGGGGKPEIKEFTLTSAQEFKACAGEKGQDAVGDTGGKGGGGMGYKGSYKSHGNGYGMVGSFCASYQGENAGVCVPGCYTGGSGSKTGVYIIHIGINNEIKSYRKAGGGAGGGSYFEIGDIKMFITGGHGESGSKTEYGKGAAPDGYVIIERLE